MIFRPGILSHPSHEMLPAEHALSQRVLEFLIANQDWFMLDTPAPNPSLVNPALTNPTSVPTPTPNMALHHQPLYVNNREFSPVSPHSSYAGIHWRDVSSERGEGGLPAAEKEIQREQERIKMIRRKTTLERGGMP